MSASNQAGPYPVCWTRSIVNALGGRRATLHVFDARQIDLVSEEASPSARRVEPDRRSPTRFRSIVQHVRELESSHL